MCNKSLDNYFCHFPTELHKQTIAQMHTHPSMQMCVHAHTVLSHLYLRKVPIIRYGQEGGGQYPFLSVATKNKPLKCQKWK